MNLGDLAVADEIFTQPDSVKRYVGNSLDAFSDLQHTVHGIIAKGNTVVAHFTAQGTHSGQWHTIAPAGKPIAYQGITIAHVENGRITEQ